MSGLLDIIEEAIRSFFIGLIESNLTTMFADVNEKTATIAEQIGQTPQGWNGNIFSMIRSLSETVIIPIAGMIITFVLCYELITMITEKNNLHEGDTFSFFKYFIKMWVAVFLVSHTFDITMAIFDVAQHVVSAASALITGSAYIDIGEVLAAMIAALQDKGIPELAALAMETLLVGNAMKLLSVLITVILYGRMIEIFLTCSVAPIPFATLTNKEWGQIGNNYIRNLSALGFQGFFMMVCVAIYTVLVQSIVLSANIHASVFQIAAYTVLLCFSLFKTGSLSKSIFNAH
ncbi:MAG: CD0415/CD1112 family protein [Anaerolineaceae bacterium]